MPLESLLQLVQTLSDRIDNHGADLRQSEALTRYALIDPLLRELGWDTANPDMVIPEYRVPNNQIADYVLLDNGHPVMVVESKKLDEPLQSGRALDQGILYCAHTGSKHFVLTDGKRWEVYGASNTTPVISFDVKDDPTQACLNALVLWQPSVMAGQVSVGQTPVLKPPEDAPIQETQATYDAPSVVSGTTTSPVSHDGNWRPLSVFNAVKGSSPPIQIRFPDNSTATVENWKSIIIAIVRWLANKDLLKPSHCPVARPRARSRYIIHSSPTHPSGNPFIAAEQVGPLYIETNSGSSTIVNQSRFIIEKVGEDPSRFKVRLS